MQIGHVFIFVPGVVEDSAIGPVTYIMHKNLMPSATVLNGGDVSKLHDNINTVFYTVAAGSTYLEFQFAAPTPLNCFAISGCNFESAGTTFVFKTAAVSSYETIASFSSARDNQPAMVCFEERLVSKVRVEISNTSELQIGELAFGVALKMPVSPSVGYKPALWNINDEVNFLRSNNNAVGRSTINKKADIEVLPFKLINHTWVKTVWVPFIKEAVGLPIWVGWNQLDYPNECVYGSWEQDEIRYETPLYASLNLTIKGQA